MFNFLSLLYLKAGMFSIRRLDASEFITGKVLNATFSELNCLILHTFVSFAGPSKNTRIMRLFGNRIVCLLLVFAFSRAERKPLLPVLRFG